jgi:hypothetical protein
VRFLRRGANSLTANHRVDFQFAPFFSINICLELSVGLTGFIFAGGMH